MADQITIQFISGLMNRTDSLTEVDGERVETLLQQYPYLTPLRYLQAAQTQQAEPWSSQMLATAKPYIGNWLQFCACLEPLMVQPFPVGEELLIADDKVWTVEATGEPEPVDEALVEELVQESEHVHVEPAIAEPAKPVAEDMQQAQHAHMDAVLEEAIEASNHVVTDDEQLIMPVFTEDYFRQQGVQVPDELPAQIEELKKDEPAGGLMVMMSFTEWLLHFRTTSQKEKEEDEAQRALKAMWQKEKLAEAMGEENDEIPENVFEMAVTSIAKEDGLASESLANIYHKQGKYEQALDMYRKLSLRNPQKNAYFAAKIEEILKEKQS